jgi:hypothetical protein
MTENDNRFHPKWAPIAAWPRRPPSDIANPENGIETPMTDFAARGFSRKRLAPLIAGLFCLAAQPCLAAEEPELPKDGPKGAAVTVLKAAKSCFSAIVEVSGILIPKEETSVRPIKRGRKALSRIAEGFMKLLIERLLHLVGNGCIDAARRQHVGQRTACVVIQTLGFPKSVIGIKNDPRVHNRHPGTQTIDGLLTGHSLLAELRG